MENTSWLKQGPEPLFPDVIWSRPENKRQAGKLLIIGGNVHGFAAPVKAFNAASRAGIGMARVIIPETLKKALGTSFAETDFAPSTPSGSFARRALDMFLENAGWADGVLFAGDFGRNSETAILLSSFLEKYSGQLTISNDVIDYFLGSGSPLLHRGDTISVINVDKLQKLGKNNLPDKPVRHAMGLYELVKILSEWKANIITKHENNFITATGGMVSTTPAKKESNWQVQLAAYASVWRLQQPEKKFEALTSAIYDFTK